MNDYIEIINYFSWKPLIEIIGNMQFYILNCNYFSAIYARLTEYPIADLMGRFVYNHCKP
jgi:hypothetical protein